MTFWTEVLSIVVALEAHRVWVLLIDRKSETKADSIYTAIAAAAILALMALVVGIFFQ